MKNGLIEMVSVTYTVNYTGKTNSVTNSVVIVGFSLCLNTSNMFNIAAELQQAQRKYAQEYAAFI